MYLLDSNIFIQASQQYYGLDFCPGFWDWLDQQNKLGHICSITMVYNELLTGKDSLTNWIKQRKKSGLFLSENDPPTQTKFSHIASLVSNQYASHEANKFLSGADPWLIAKAQALGATVVTQERLVPHNSPKVKIPNICREVGVPVTDTFTLLRQLGAKFELKP